MLQEMEKKVEILFQDPLNGANGAVKYNYIIYWSGEPGMELVDKWETEGKSQMQTATRLTGISPSLRNIFLKIQCFDHNSGTEETVPG